MNRTQFLAQVERAVESGNRFRHPLPAPGGVRRCGYVGGGTDLPARLVAEVRAVGGEGFLVADWIQAGRQLEALLAAQAPCKCLAWEHPLLDRLGLAEMARRLGCELFDREILAALPPEVARARELDAKLGVTSVAWAVAETGTLALASGAVTPRVTSLLPPVHVAVVGADQILPDLFDLFDRLGSPESGELPSTINLITGPSKTGDIELQLTTGVHGPGRWQVIVCREVC